MEDRRSGLKRTSSRAVLFLAAVVTMVLSRGCAYTRTLVEASPPLKPSWIHSLPELPGYVPVRGISTDAPTLEAGRAGTRSNAAKEFAKIVGDIVTVDDRGVVEYTIGNRMRPSILPWSVPPHRKTEFLDHLQHVVGENSTRLISNMREHEMYSEKYMIGRGCSQADNRYNVYVLYKVPEKDLERAIKFAVDEYETGSMGGSGPALGNNVGMELLGRARQFAERGMYEDALLALKKARISLSADNSQEGVERLAASYELEGSIYEAQGRWDDALKVYERAYAVVPDSKKKLFRVLKDQAEKKRPRQ